MKLSELIEEIKKAIELASKGKWSEEIPPAYEESFGNYPILTEENDDEIACFTGLGGSALKNLRYVYLVQPENISRLIPAIEKMRAALEYYAKPVMNFQGHATLGQSRSVLKTRHSMTKAREVLKELG